MGGDPSRQHRERADPGDRDPAGLGKRPSRRDPDPQAGVGAGSEADRNPLHLVPSATGFDRALDLGEQRSGVLRAPVRTRPGGRLADQLATVRQGHGGVRGGGIDPEYSHAVNSIRFARSARVAVAVSIAALAAGVAGCGSDSEDVSNAINTAQNQLKTANEQIQKGLSQAEQQAPQSKKQIRQAQQQAQQGIDQAQKKLQEEQQSGGY
jgi:hypothetical protein